MSVIATPIGSPSAADITSESNVGIVIAPFSQSYDDVLKLRVRAARLRQGVAASVQINLLNPAGQTLDLTDYGLVSGSSSSSSSSSETAESPTASGLAAKIREASELSYSTTDADVTIVTAESGIVRITIPATIYNNPAVYWLEVAILNADGTPFYIYPCYLYIERSSWAADGKVSGPPLIDAIRLSLRDSDMYENLLIEHNDFDIAEIAAATVRTVQFWNEQPPPVSRILFSTKTMPFQDIWLEGIQLFLFQMAEEHYRRNKLPYQAGGLTTDDKNRDKEYKNAWQERYQTFRGRVINKKAVINLAGGFRTIRQF
jgi:hypothetical protein